MHTMQDFRTCSIFLNLQTSYHEANSILYAPQHGFRKIDHVRHNLLTIHDIATCLNSENQVDVLFLDFSKAFDKAPHKCSLYKLSY